MWIRGLGFLVLGVSLCAPSAWSKKNGERCAKIVAETAREYHSVPPKLMPIRRPEEMRELNILAYNLLNLAEHVGKFRPVEGRLARVGDARTKDERFRIEQAQIVHELLVDIGILPEVESKTALQQFSEAYLENTYSTQLIRGNDERGIDVGWLLKRDLPFEIELRTNKHMTWDDPQGGRIPLFSRDLPVLILRLPGEKKPFLILVGTHYKSKRDRSGDTESRQLRGAQVAGTVKVIQGLQQEFGATVPIVFGGDANGNVHNEAEYALLKRALALEDSFDVIKPALTREERITHTFHPQGQPAKADQLDVLLITPSLRECVKTAFVYRYKDAGGKVKVLPRTYEERKQNPSDHFPILLKLDFDCLMRLAQARPEMACFITPIDFSRPRREAPPVFSRAG